MEGVTDPIGQGWQTLWLAGGGAIVYLLLDLLVLARNSAFRRGAALFRVGFLVLLAGVVLGATAFFAYAANQVDRTNQLLISSYVARAIGIVALVIGLARMRAKESS